MKKFSEKIRTWWYFHVKNPVVRKGESKDGAFKWTFRRFDLTIETLSGNFKAKYVADEHPYAYLLQGATDDNIEGFCQLMYVLGKTLTTDQGLANDVGKAVSRYQKRLEKQAASEVVEDETEEKIALETEKQIQEVVEMDKKTRRKYEHGVDGKFKAAVKKAEKLAE